MLFLSSCFNNKAAIPLVSIKTPLDAYSLYADGKMVYADKKNYSINLDNSEVDEDSFILWYFVSREGYIATVYMYFEKDRLQKIVEYYYALSDKKKRVAILEGLSTCAGKLKANQVFSALEEDKFGTIIFTIGSSNIS
jgi:hypothetical protein